MGQNSSSGKSEREFLSQYNSIYQVMYDQKHIKDFLLYLRQKLSEKGHFVQITGEKLFSCFQDDLETICLKLSLSDIDQATAINIYDYLQYIVYSQSKMTSLKADYENYIFLLKNKISNEKSHHNKEYKTLFERFLSKYEELKEMIGLLEQLDIKTIKACLKTCSQKYPIPQSYQGNNFKRSQDKHNQLYQDRDSTLTSIQQYQNDEQFEAY